MAIIDKNIVLGFGDVGIKGTLKGKVFEPTAKIRFSQLKSPHFDPHPDNEDNEVVPITIVCDLHGLEILYKLTSQLLEEVYDQQLAAIERERLQAQKM